MLITHKKDIDLNSLFGISDSQIVWLRAINHVCISAVR